MELYSRRTEFHCNVSEVESNLQVVNAIFSETDRRTYLLTLKFYFDIWMNDIFSFLCIH